MGSNDLLGLLTLHLKIIKESWFSTNMKIGRIF